ncbi:MAG TPA: putative DNA-binding domain-containing protein [Terracidiphilus sp.]|nr:putative DNA-binding domain-containing protein [Terracidiphilus sp.]
MNLESIQREMAAAVMQPLTPDETMQSHSADGREMTDVADSFVAPNSRLTPFERLEIYNRQYWFRVLNALAEDFIALRAVLGSRKFHTLSVAYLNHHPSRSFTLRNLGSQLPAWLAAHKDLCGRRHAIAVDIAKIEWAFVVAFDSAERPPLTLEQIASLDGASRLALQPHIELMELDNPAEDLVLELHQREKRQTSEAGVEIEEQEQPPVKLPRLRRRPTWLAAHRVEFSVYYLRLEREAYRILIALKEGKTLADAIEDGFAESRIPASRRAAMLQQWFNQWAELGWICARED